MFRRRSSQGGGADAAASLLAGPQSSDPEPAAADTDTALGSALTVIRQHSGRRRSSDPATSAASTDAPLKPQAGQLTPIRKRVAQSAAQSAGSSLTTAAQQPVPSSLQPHAASSVLQQAADAVSVSADPAISAADDAAAATAAAEGAWPARTRQPALLKEQQQQLMLPLQQQEHQQQTPAKGSPDQMPLLAAVAAPASDAQQASTTGAVSAADVAEQRQQQPQPQEQHCPVSTPVKHSCLLAAGHKTLRFEVYPASVQAGDAADEGIVDYDGHDQELPGAAGGTAQQQQQQYTYHEATGQLCRMGEGADSTRLARHYLEDWNTGDFCQLSQPSIGCLAWLRRAPRGLPPLRSSSQGEEPTALRSLADFADSMGSVMAALGLFAQGLAGGLALLCLFMTYLQYGSRGRDGFLAYYSSLAQMVNRAFFTLISLSLVAASSRLAYDSLVAFQPGHLRLRVVDVTVLGLYLLGYTVNLVATPTDDQLTYEARRDLHYWQQAPLPAAFLARLAAWHGLNLVRLLCCGFAWCLVCYRSNPYVMMAVFEARRQAVEEGSGDELVLRLGTPAGAAAAGAGVATDGRAAGQEGGCEMKSPAAAAAAGTAPVALLRPAGQTAQAAAAADRQQQQRRGPLTGGGAVPPLGVAAAVGGSSSVRGAHQGSAARATGSTTGGIGSGRLAPGAAFGWGAVC